MQKPVLSLFDGSDLKELNLRDKHLSVRTLRLLGPLFGFFQNVTQLNLRINQLGDEGAKTLAQNTTLTSLSLRFNKIEDEGAQALAQNITLTSLDLRFNKIEDEGTKAFLDPPSLTKLSLLQNPKITEEAKDFLRQNTRLKELRFSDNTLLPF